MTNSHQFAGTLALSFPLIEREDNLSSLLLSFDSWSISSWTLPHFPVFKQDIWSHNAPFLYPLPKQVTGMATSAEGKVICYLLRRWSQSTASDHSRHTLSYTVHTRAAITPISPPILVIVQDSGIWYKAQVEGRIQALILVDVQIGAHSDPLTGNMVTWRKTLTVAQLKHLVLQHTN